MKQHNETIFDYNPTDTELKRFGGKEGFAWLEEHGLELFSCDDDRYYALALLFSGRGNKEKFAHYCSLVKNKDMLKTFMQDF